MMQKSSPFGAKGRAVIAFENGAVKKVYGRIIECLKSSCPQ
jgi:hypothetical protein